MRYFLVFLFVLISAVPLAAQAAPVDFFGPIVSEACRNCPTAPGWGCVLQAVQNLIRFAISLGIVLATLALVYAGFIWMTSGANPGRREQGRTLLINVFIGLFVMLSAWLVVDFVMKTLYDGAKGGFGPWNSILAGTGSDQCLVATTPVPITEGVVGIVIGSGSGTGVGRCTPIPDANLVAINNAGHKLIPDAAQRFNAMREAASQDGVSLVVSSAYRSPDDQLRAWNQNGCRLVKGRAVCQTRTAAIPCSLGGSGSNHSRGTAVDISLTSGVYDWLQENAGRFGFYNNLPNDLPHWSDTGR